MAGTTAAVIPGIALLAGLPDTQRALAAARVPDAARAGAGTGSAQVTVGGAELRPPSVPLAVRSPYLSTWLPSTELTAAVPQFWYGGNRGFAGLVRIDGNLYAWAGRPEVSGALVTALAQSSLQVTATRSVFTLAAGGVELTAEWLSPIEPGDLKRQSAPFSLLTVSVQATDGASHDVQLYADITGEWASSRERDKITWKASTTKDNRYWSVRLKTQTQLKEDAQMAQWGSVVWGSPRSGELSYQSGYDVDVRDLFATAGKLADTSDKDYRAIDDRRPVFAFARDFGAVGATQQSAQFAIGHVRTPLVSYGHPDAKLLAPLWTKYWPDAEAMADFVLADAAAARSRAIELDATIQGAATSAAGSGYSAMCALAARQCYGGTELAIGPDGSTWLLGKEISSDGDTNTVDIFDQAYLMWLYMDPDRVPLVMAPILTWCDSAGWQTSSFWKGKKTKYCVHDLGVYPVASGRAPGDGEQMPVEESAGMLIMAASYARKVGATTARAFLARWTKLWTQWADYLLTQVPSPATQLTTDDWVPIPYVTPAHGVNLGIKAIVGLAAASQIATILGDTANATKWSKAARDNVRPWVTRSTNSKSDPYLNLEQGAKGTWTCVYNAYYQQVIGEDLVPESVAAEQASFYLGKLTTYGMPLQTGVRDDTNKVEWLVYLAAWLRSYPVAGDLLSRSVAFINDTPSLVPYPDRYDTANAVGAPGIKAHPTLGAVFALLAP